MSCVKSVVDQLGLSSFVQSCGGRSSLHASGLGLAETAKRFVGVMSLTWAGSQVTKVPCSN